VSGPCALTLVNLQLTTKATALNDYFVVYSHNQDDGLLPTFPMRVEKDTFIDSIDFSPATMLLRALKYCKHVNIAYDPDGFTTFVVKQFMYSLVNPLCVF